MSVLEAKQRFGEVVEAVQRGLTVRVTRRGREVARIVPVAAEGTGLEDRLADLVRAGMLDPARADRPRLPRPYPIRPIGQAQRLLQEDRGA